MVGRGHVKHRRPRHEGIVHADAKLRSEDKCTRDHGAMRDNGTLRESGGSTGIKDHETIFRFGDNRRAPAISRQQALILRADADRRARLVIDRSSRRGKLRLDDQHLWRHEIDAVGKFASRQTPVEAGRDDAKICCREFDLEVFGAVARQQSDAIAAHQAERRQHRARAIHPVEQFPVADPAVAMLDRNRGCRNARTRTKQCTDRDREPRPVARLRPSLGPSCFLLHSRIVSRISNIR